MGQRTNLKDTARQSATPRMTEVLFLAHETALSDETFYNDENVDVDVYNMHSINQIHIFKSHYLYFLQQTVSCGISPKIIRRHQPNNQM